MNKLKIKTYLMTSKNSTPLLLILLSFSLPIMTTACSSTSHKRDLTMRVLDEQSELLRRIKVERQAEKISKKVQADPTLSDAESHLDTALEAVLEANATVKASF